MWLLETVQVFLLSCTLFVVARQSQVIPATKFLHFHKTAPMKEVAKDKVMNSTKVFVYTHDFETKTLNESGAYRVKDAVFRNKRDVDLVMIADWSDASFQPQQYSFVAETVLPVIADHVVTAIVDLRNRLSFKYENVELGGHGMGAHLMGQVGEKLSFANKSANIRRILAFNPAGPKFRSNDRGKIKTQRLSKAHATEVHVIHTDRGYGLWESVGHRDDFIVYHPLLVECESTIFTNDRCKHQSAVDIGIAIGIEGGNLVPKKRPTFIYVLDASDSMQRNSKMVNMINATKETITSLPLNITIGIFLFGTTAEVAHPLINMTTEAIRSQVIGKVPAPSMNMGWTSIGAGLKLAYRFYRNDNPVTCPHIILISDGEENRQPYIKDTTTPTCTIIHGIGFGSASSTKLRALADATKGGMDDVDIGTISQTLQKLKQSFRELANAGLPFHHRSVTLPTRTIVWAGKETQFNFTLDRGLGNKTEITVYSPQASYLVADLISPTNKTFTNTSFTLLGNDLLVFRSDLVEYGNWTIILKDNSNKGRKKRNTNEKTAIISVVTFIKSSDTFPVQLTAAVSHSYLDYAKTNGEPLRIFGKLTKGEDMVLGGTLNSIITVPNGKDIGPIELKDDGNDSDDKAYDGIYSASFIDPLQNGVKYGVKVEARCDGACRVRNSSSLSYIPFSFQDVMELEILPGQLGRESDAGTVVSVGTFVSPKPSQVKDLKVTLVDVALRHVSVEWTAPGGKAGSGRTKSQNLTLATSISDLLNGSGTLCISSDNKSNIVDGSVEPLEYGRRQNVTIQLPLDFWNKTIEAQKLYVVHEAMNSEGKVGERSPVAMALMSPKEETGEQAGEQTVIWAILLSIGCVTIAIAIATVVVVRWKGKFRFSLNFLREQSGPPNLNLQEMEEPSDED